MATKKKRSSLKRMRQTARRTEFKTLGRSAARTAVRTARAAIAGGGAAAAQALGRAQSALDKAAKRGAIHRNAAARRKSRIAKASGKAGAKPAS